MVPEGGVRQRELRIAPVMTGGSSLAVWMGGVTAELFRLVMATRDPDASRECAVYRGLLELTQTKPRVDVVTGTSAGGLNGVLLAAAWRRDLRVKEFMQVRDLWLSLGDLGSLLRSAGESDPPSLLKGDDYFQAELRSVLRRWGERTRSRRLADGDERPVDLLITVSTLTGEPKMTTDDFGQPIGEVEFAHRLRFLAKDFAAEDWPEKLSLAARTSASLPAVFEPSYLPVGDPRPPYRRSTHPDLGPNASFASSRWAVDGGVIVNLPLGEAIDRIYHQPAGNEVRRVILYVKPTPDVPEPGVADNPSEMPTMAQALLSIATGPRAETIIEDIELIRRRNLEADRQKEARIAGVKEVAAPGTDLVDFARTLFPIYRRIRSLNSVARMMETVRSNLPTDAVVRQPDIERALRRSRSGSVARRIDDSAQRGERWAWGIRSIEHGLDALFDIQRDLLSIPHVSIVEGRDAPAEELANQRRRLMDAKAAAFRVLEEVELFRRLDRTYWSAAVAGLTIDAREDWAERSYEEWPFGASGEDGLAAAREVADDFEHAGFAPFGDDYSQPAALRRLSEIARRVARCWIETAEIAERFVGPATELLEPDHRSRSELAGSEPEARLAAMVNDTATDPGTTYRREYARRIDNPLRVIRSIVPVSGQADLDLVLTRLLALHVIDSSLEGGTVARSQQIELMQVSWDAPNELDPMRSREEKLAGTEIGRLGAFLKPSWRANDWFWGRMDGAQRLIRLLLDPSRLRQLGLTREEVFERIRSLVLGEGATGPHDVRFRRWQTDRLALSKELAFLSNYDTPLPDSLPTAEGLLALATQIDIAIEELPHIRQAISASAERGSAPTAVAFSEKFDREVAGPRPEPETVVGLVRSMRVGQERAADELGGDLLVTTATHAMNVGVRGISGTHGVKGLGRLLLPLRQPASIVHTFVKATTLTSRVGVTLAVLAMTIAAAIVAAWWSGFDVGTFPRLGAVVVLLTGTTLAFIRARAATGVIVLAVLGFAGFAVVGEGWTEFLTTPDDAKVSRPVSDELDFNDATVRVENNDDGTSQILEFDDATLTVLGGEVEEVRPARSGEIPAWKADWFGSGTDADGLRPYLRSIPVALAALAVIGRLLRLSVRGSFRERLSTRDVVFMTVTSASAIVWWFEASDLLPRIVEGDADGFRGFLVDKGESLAPIPFTTVLIVLTLTSVVLSAVMTRIFRGSLRHVGRRLVPVDFRRR